MPLSLPTVRQEKLLPDPAGTAELVRRVGYTLEEALADLVDNSLDANARNVLIRFERSVDRVVRVIVVDDGHGMTENELHRAMQYGVRSQHAETDLGKYGIGLKSASFSQARSVTAISRKAEATSGRRWTIKSVKKDWRLEVIEARAAKAFFAQKWGVVENRRHGTVVLWDDLEIPPSALMNFEHAHSNTVKDLAIRLGIRFHRFLEKGSLTLSIDTVFEGSDEAVGSVEVLPYDPFGYSATGRKGYPATFVVDLGADGKLKLIAHIWPPKSKSPNYKLGGGEVASRQGFYFYRNNRLIRAGGWHKLQSDTEPHSSLARVAVDIHPRLDSFFKLTIQKNDIKVPELFLDAVRASMAGNTTFDDYLKAAQDTYRNAPEEEGVVYLPTEGIPSGAAKRIACLLEDGNDAETSEVSFRWSKLKDGKVFEIDREDSSILLNLSYRSKITGGQNSKADAPLIKILLFFIGQEVLSTRRLSSRKRDHLALINRSLKEVLRDIA